MTTAAQLVTRARVEGLVIALAASGYLWEAQQIPTMFQTPGVPGPTAFPTILGLALGLAGLWRLVMGASVAELATDAAEPASDVAAGLRGWVAAHGRFYAMWGVVLGFLALMPYVGFPVGAAVGIALMTRLLGERRWWMCATVAVVAAAVLHLAFALGLGVRLPLGLLSFVTK